MMPTMKLALPVALLLVGANAFSFQVNNKNSQQRVTGDVERRRDFLQNSAAAVVGAAFGMSSFPTDALASGGATAGKYTYVFLLHCILFRDFDLCIKFCIFKKRCQ